MFPKDSRAGWSIPIAVVESEPAEEGIVGREIMIGPHVEVVFRGRSGSAEDILSAAVTKVASVGQRIQSVQIRLNRRIHGDLVESARGFGIGNFPLPGGNRWHGCYQALPQAFSQAFIAAEIKRFVLADRATQAGSKLITPERRGRTARIEKVSRIESRIAQEFKRRSMQLIGARLGYDVNDAPGGTSKLSAVGGRFHAKLAHRIHAKGLSTHAAGDLVRRAHHIGAIQQKAVLLRSRPANGHFEGKSTLYLPSLEFRIGDSRLQQGKLIETPAVERQVHNLLRLDHSRDR
jgi:hypothetical protein